MKKTLSTIAALTLIIAIIPTTAFAHSGRHVKKSAYNYSQTHAFNCNNNDCNFECNGYNNCSRKTFFCYNYGSCLR